jgi:hypothetical protein
VLDLEATAEIKWTKLLPWLWPCTCLQLQEKIERWSV